MVKKTKDEAIETRNLILDTAEKVFAEKGVSRTTLSDIADAAGFTRGAIYGHFKNKAEVFAAMFCRVELPMETLFQAAIEGVDESDPLGRLREQIITLLKESALNERRRRVLNILMQKCEWTEEMGPVLAQMSEAMDAGRERSRQLLSQAVELGHLPPDLNVHRAEFMLHALVIGCMKDWLFRPQTFDLASEADAVVNGYLDMLRCSPALR
jgi:TetR/AcrR family transcriptional regulator, acrAB operon repressor